MYTHVLSHTQSCAKVNSLFLSEMEARMQWDYTFKMLKENDCQPRILYPATLSFRNEGKTKTFPNKQKMREFIASNSYTSLLMDT